jgi:3'(2'), 5'-bisphosphate nucleotidase
MNRLLETAIKAGIEAGGKILEIYSKDFDVEFKADESPLTQADMASHQVIIKHLQPLGIPILSEEGRDIPYEERKSWSRLWIVDPLDGTKEFVKRNGEFTVNIALIEQGRPVMGVIYIPVTGVLYFASAEMGARKVEGVGEWKDGMLEYWVEHSQRLPIDYDRKVFTIVGSKSHMTPETAEYMEKLKQEHGEVEVLSRGSSLKITMVAEGAADIYPRFAPTMEWDVAAGHAIVRFAGARMVRADDGEELVYNKEELLNPWFIVQR